MKLRIRGDSLRLRLSQSEVTAIDTQARVEDTIHFVGSRLTYALVAADDVAEISVAFDGSTLVVSVPRDQLLRWARTDQIGLSHEQPLPRGALAVLIEKDFKCVQPRAGEEDYDGFPNPTGRC